MTGSALLVSAGALLALTGLSHIARPEQWRRAIGDLGRSESGWVVYAFLHLVMACALLVGARTAGIQHRAALWGAAVLGALYAVKGSGIVLFPDAARASMRRGANTGTGAIRLVGLGLGVLGAGITAGASL